MMIGVPGETDEDVDACVQFVTLDLHSRLPAVGTHFRAALQHFPGYLKALMHDRRRTFFARKFQPRLPAGNREFAADLLGEVDRFIAAIGHA